MQLILKADYVKNIFPKLNIKSKLISKAKLKGFEFNYDEIGRFNLINNDLSKEDVVVVNLSDDDIYKLDVFQSSLDFYKEKIDEKNIIASKKKLGEVYSYFKVDKNSYSKPLTIEEVSDYIKLNSQINHCDLNLLIPGKLNKGTTYKDLKICKNKLSDIRNSCYEGFLKTEYTGELSKELLRFPIGEVRVILENKGKEQAIRGLIEMAYHTETRFCVCEIYIPNAILGANKIINKYTADYLNFEFNGKRIENVEALLSEIGVRTFGTRRSMVFSNFKISDEELVNCLINEEHPMGKIGGKYGDELLNDNIAIYDTAEVYLSVLTMVEKCKEFSENYVDRIEYEIGETFFVEELLLEDAAIDKIYKDLDKAQKDELNNIEGGSSKFIEDISFDIAKAKKFSDFDAFRYPTVKTSAKNIADRFGIDYVYDRYEENRNILEQLVNINKDRIRKNESEVTETFLFLISAISMFDKVIGIVDDFINNIKISYVIGILIVIIFYIIYKFLLKKHKEKIYEKKKA